MLRLRILTAIVAAALLFVVLFALPPAAARGVIAAVILLAGWEWASFLRLGTWPAKALYVGLLAACMAVLLLALTQGVLSLPVVFGVAMLWWFAALCGMFFYPTAVPQGLAWIAGLLVLLPAWQALDLVYTRRPALLLFMLILVFAADVGAYFAGKAFGRVKLAPAISPGKTWEGVLGGMLLVALLSGLGAYWFAWPLSVLLPFGIAVGLTSVVGDLTVSVFKRSAGIKDSGSLFPGHGGLLDRIDSVTAAAPLFALGLYWGGL